MKRQRRAWRALLLGIVMVLMLPTGAWALTDEEIFRDFRFNFVNPGARALGLGGAFVAAGDDATAAQSNPAALFYVPRPEVFLEYRNTRYDTVVFQDQIGDLSRPDPDLPPPGLPFLDLETTTKRETTSIPSFVSFAYPFRIGSRKATFALSRQVVLDIRNSLSDPAGGTGTDLRIGLESFEDWLNPDTGEVEWYTVNNLVTGTLDCEIVHYNLGLSLSLTQDFSIGLTGTYASLDMKSDVTSVSDDPRGLLYSAHPRLVTEDGVFAPIQVATGIDGTDNGFAYAVGVHWHPDSVFPGAFSPLRFGFVYRRGAELSVTEQQSELSQTTNLFEVSESFDNIVRVPDQFALGMSYEAGRHWMFTAEGERIQYSDLLKGFRPGVNFFTSGRIPSTLLPIDPSKLVFTVDDATVVRGGIEYFVPLKSRASFAVRAGFYNAPDNRIRLTEVNSGDPEIDQLFLSVFRGGESLNHVTAGFSVNTPSNIGLAFQVAGDVSKETTEIVVSTIWRFGKTR